ncbi:MAG: hypothetical protein J5637_02485 [Prevotella sp.]|nr:hypothetical protein [Prevotella sp.]
MKTIKDQFKVSCDAKPIGTYYVYANGDSSYDSYELPEGYTKERLVSLLKKIAADTYRLKGTRKHIWQSGPIKMERVPKDVEKYMVYQCGAEKGDPTYSPKSHSAPHYEGRYIEGMEEWASWYCFNKKDDGMYEAELDEAWNEGCHNGGGTIRVEVPEAWLDLSYDEFLERLVTLASASHFGFTPEDLKGKVGLKGFFGFRD